MGAFHLQPAQLGAVFSSSSWGFLCGALVGGPVADRWGRKPLLIASNSLFAVCTIATPLVTDLQSLLIVRTVAGIGLGAAAPCFVSIATEYVPRRLRARLVTILWAALPGGGVIVGFLGPLLLPSIGCSQFSILAVRCLCSRRCWSSLSCLKSIVFAVTRGYDAGRFALYSCAWLRRLRVRVHRASLYPRKSGPVCPSNTFSDGRAWTTLLLWVAFFANYFALIALLVWTPTLLRQAGMPVGEASRRPRFQQHWWCRRLPHRGVHDQTLGPYRILVLAFVAACLTIALTGYFDRPAFIPVWILETMDGLLIGGGGAGLIAAFSALLYPTHIRSTGIGWGLGLGRLGGATGPLAAGALVGAAWTPAEVFLVIGCAALPAAAAVAIMRALAPKPFPAGSKVPASLIT